MLPLATLAAAVPHLATLAALGCTRWGQLRALPRAGVARRFGAPLLQALDQACGQARTSHPWLLLPEVFDVSLELAAQVETAPALLFGARRLLHAAAALAATAAAGRAGAGAALDHGCPPRHRHRG